MKHILKIFLIIIGAIAFLVAVDLAYYYNNAVPFWDRKSAIETTLEWGGLAEFPEEIKVRRIETYGSAFSREFYLIADVDNSFPESVDSWIANSKRLKNTEPAAATKTSQIEVFDIIPGENESNGGWVMIDRFKGVT